MESYASNEPRIGIVKTAMDACAQIAVFTYAEMRRTPRYEIRLAAFYADNLMNSTAHCGGSLKPDELPKRQKALRQISVSACEFSKAVDKVYLIRTGTAPGDIHVAGRLS